MVFWETVVYPTGMIYFAVIPSLLCGLAVSVNDIRQRRVPRMWIALGMAAQCLAYVVYGVLFDEPLLCVSALVYAVVAAVIQLVLALLRPGAVGFGDVTATAMLGYMMGAYGLTRFVLWWLLMGIVGLLWIALWQWFAARYLRNSACKVPFVPVILCSAVIAML